MKMSPWLLFLGLAVSYTAAAAAAPGTIHTDTCIQPLKSMLLLSVVSKLYTCCVRLFLLSCDVLIPLPRLILHVTMFN